MISENVYTSIIPGLGVKQATALEPFTLRLKILILLYKQRFHECSYYLRVINVFLKLGGSKSQIKLVYHF